MSQDRNPQAEQMGDESMVRNLAFQAEAIWPQERQLFDRYGLSGALRILDVGCGTGEISRRLAELYPMAMVTGIDILESNLALARRDSSAAGRRIEYQLGDAFGLAYRDTSIDLLVCRHMSQAVPNFPQVLAEFTRVLKPGGWLHLLSEDYGMLHMPVGDRDPDRFWNEVVIGFLASIGCDGRIGRHCAPMLQSLGYEEVAVDYVTVDTLRVPRATFANILRAWRDGYAGSLAVSSGRSLAAINEDFAPIIHAVETPPFYAAWQVPVISGRRP